MREFLKEVERTEYGFSMDRDRGYMYDIVNNLIGVGKLTHKKMRALDLFISKNYTDEEYVKWIRREIDELDAILVSIYNSNEESDKRKTTYIDWLAVDYTRSFDVLTYNRRLEYREAYRLNKLNKKI